MASQRRGVDVPPPAARNDGGDAGEDAEGLFRKWMESPARPDGRNVILVDSRESPEVLRDLVLARIRNDEGAHHET
jgi:hypothetical protein